MRSVILGTAGHVDHGKTALVEALTGINTDRLREERERGITIDLGFANYPTRRDGLELSVVDVPGHEGLVKNMLAGATGFDVLLLVVAADEGPMPQTREHLAIANLLGVRNGVVALSKVDLVDSDWLQLVTDSLRRELLETIGFDDWPIVPVSVVSKQGIEELDRAIIASAARAPSRHSDDLFRLPIDRSFTVRGVGTVVTGTIWSGRVQVGDELRLLPGGSTARVRGIQVHGRDSPVATAGQRGALALVGLDREAAGRGRFLVSDRVWRAHDTLEVKLSVLPDSPWQLRHWQRVRFHLGTAETMARLVLPRQKVLGPGGTSTVGLRLEAPVVARAGDRFVIRFYSPVVSVGGGVILDPWAPRRRREPAAVFEPLALEALENLISMGGDLGAQEDELPVLSGLRPSEITRHLSVLERDGVLLRVGGRAYSRAITDRARASVLNALREHHESEGHSAGLSLESLRSGQSVPAALVDATLADLAAAGDVRVVGSLASLAGHAPRLEAAQETLAAAALGEIRRGGAAPPGLKELSKGLGVAENELRPVLRFLDERGDIVGVAPDLYLDTGVMADVTGRVERFLSGGRMASPSELRDVVGVSRKYLIPLLEHFDSTGLTRRTAKGRSLR